MPRLFVLLLLLAVAGVHAAPPVLLEATTTMQRLAPYVALLEDPDGTLTIDAVRQPEVAARFVPHSGAGDINLGYSRSAWWLRVTLAPGATAPPDWRLEVAFPTLDEVVVHPPDGDAPLLGGDRRPFAERPLHHRSFVYPLRLEPGRAVDLHLRVRSDGTLTVPLTLWQPAALHAHDQNTYALHALYYGMLLALGLYNLLLWLSLRERSYLAYVAFVAAMAVGQAAQGGFGYQYLWPEWPEWQAMAFNSGYAATGFFGALFTRVFLDTARHHPRLDRLILGLAAGFALTAIGPAFVPYRLAAIGTSLLGVTFAGVAVVTGFVCLRRGDAGARFFLAAWTLLLFGVAAMGLRNLSLLPTHVLTVHGIQIGSALEMLLLSFALADRIHLLRREKEGALARAARADRHRIEQLEDSERTLEARVGERTRELAEANARLTEREARLRDMALHDPLTGLANRTRLDERVAHALARSQRSERPFGLLLIDLDGFKAVNDRLGHAAGDQLLRTVADRLRGCTRAADTVARLGGDEFVVLVEDARDHETLRAVGGKIVRALGEPVALAEGGAAIGASVGGALWPGDGEDARTLLGAADRAMYAAKRNGGGSVEAGNAR